MSGCIHTPAATQDSNLSMYDGCNSCESLFATMGKDLEAREQLLDVVSQMRCFWHAKMTGGRPAPRSGQQAGLRAGYPVPETKFEPGRRSSRR
ncbi:hypothetical protein AC579_7130 [Pseudocercospora musae]|uniref:Uncharacterized protein n=1 Tax=Pseudocercospora musae TaxID=113226 RepID=A0A139IND7_9PEZI|nr:hypothetical protein AC579_7130 [Pseudocercospora musae]